MSRRGSGLRSLFSESDYDAHRRDPNGFVHVAVKETAIQKDVLDLLRKHPKVAWAHRFNSAAGQLMYPDGKSSRFMRFGFPGMADIMGQLRGSGRFLAIEVKRPGEKPTDDQIAFLDAVNGAGGVGFVAYRLDCVLENLLKV